MNKFLIALTVFFTLFVSTNAFSESWCDKNKQGNDLKSIVFYNGSYIAVGECGTILTSKDGEKWDVQKIDISEDFNKIIVNGGASTIVGNNGIILTSKDGIKWERPISPTTENLNDIIFADNKYIAVGDNGVIIASDGNGMWMEKVSNTKNNLKSIAFGGNNWIAVGDAAEIVISIDGDSFTPLQVSSTDTRNLNSIIYDESNFVAVGDNGAFLSPDSGTSWTLQEISTVHLRYIYFSSNAYYVAGGNGKIFFSTDKKVWKEGILKGNRQINSIFYWENKYVAVGNSGTILASADGINWVSKNMPVKIEDIDYSTKYFLLHAGAVLLNPYTLKKNQTTGNFELESTGKTDTHYYVELLYKHRNAWWKDGPNDKPNNSSNSCLEVLRKWDYWDIDGRIGFASSNSDPSGAVVAGAGDAYLEVSAGPSWMIPNDDNDDRISVGIEALGGLVTDKGSQSIHNYYGFGPVISVGIPFKTKSNDIEHNRKVEIVGGIYKGWADMPKFKGEDTLEVEVKNKLPVFESQESVITRGEAHIPVGQAGFLIISGKYYTFLNKRGTVSPWTVSLGYTIPIEKFADGILKAGNAVFEQ